MVIDDQTEEADSITSLSELNRHLESILPEVYLDDIYKYLRDCEVSCSSIPLIDRFSLVIDNRSVTGLSHTICVNSPTSQLACALS